MSLSRDIKVGIFVLTGLLCIGIVIFLIGDEKQLFTGREYYKTAFSDVQGLKRGAPVRMGGINVGTVEGVGYGDNAKDTVIYVQISIVEREAARIRTDTVASIAGKGLLGDKMLELSVGDPKKPVLPPGSVIKNEEPRDFTEMLDSLSRVSTKVERVVTNLESTSKELASDEFHEDVRGITHSLSNILKTIDEGDGYAKRLLADPKEAERLSRVVGNLEQTSAELSRAARGVGTILERVQTGPGLAHDLVYKDEASRTLAQLGGAADEFSTTLRGIREGNGLAKSMLYGDEGSSQLMGNLNQVTQDVSQIVADIKAGKGTLGALLVDPSVYEDVKLLLGNVERNKTLRALVRYSIKQDERAPRIEVKDDKGRAARAEGPSQEE